MATVHNPGIPYVGPIPGGLHDGLQIHVSGTPEQHHNGFLISLQAGGSIDPRSDCAFVFNPRFTDNQVVRNSCQNNSWGAEERHGGFPFRKGHHCDVVIHVKPHHYSVSVNGAHFCDFNHRLQKHRVTHITVEQGIRVNNIRFEGRHGGHGGGIGAALGQFAGALFNEFSGGHERPHHKHHPPHQHPPPHGGGSGYPPSGGASYPYPGGGPIFNPPVPFVQGMGGIYPNKMIFISGVPHPNPSRFTVYLQQGSQHEPHHIGMCFDARFNYGNDRNVVVRNHKQGNWGQEERHVTHFPFMPNGNFEMIILIEPHCYKVAVNNQHLLEFNHRVRQLNLIDTLRIDGDLRLTQVRFQG
ncbi:galectin-8-like isoform X3 [Ruditapes philippinarum]|uniref:galectin-8-like isoform X3 n=1 Tax=Ruditapes philippinarum TaxID=129788 RepID=UPI00295BD7D4|nr:galectin-8-like isoform X3 [Ruditapes philippinarum]